MKRSIYAIVAVVLFLAAVSSQAQQPKISSGTYTTYVSNEVFGVENYTFTTNADGSIQSQSDGNLGPTKFKTTTKAERNRPVNFVVTTNSGMVQADFAGEVVKITIPGQPVKEVKAQPTVLIENGVWHHFLFLFAQYDPARSAPQTFSAFLPSQAVPFTLSLERLDSPILKVSGQPVTTEHFRAGTSLGLIFEIWTDSSGVPLFIQVPAQHLKIVRKGSEALAELISPTPPKPVASANDPYTTEEVSFQNGEQKLVGTLTIPKKGAAPFPGVVVISGSGPQDRDGTTVANLYRLVAENLSANGVAVLRVDDRGVGKSIPLKPDTSYRDLINDSKAAFEFLSTQPQIDPRKIALTGHSEGALTALVIAAEDPRVAAVMLLAGGSRSLDRIVFEQTLNLQALNSPVNPADKTRYPPLVAQLDKVFSEVRSKPKPADAAKDPLAYFRQHLETDPLAIARRVHVPTLILNGERDDNVLPYHALELAQAMADAGNKQVLLRIFLNLTHVFTPSTRDKAVTSGQAEEVSPEVLDLLQRWANNVLVRGKDGGAVPEK
ncbi:MAG TPA: alpha/beta fold hydrolase [Pyrinomonadaceae bacterium]|nr:alpha/beta fold hydrolase [Pyrinomonadaceae bacterium]